MNTKCNNCNSDQYQLIPNFNCIGYGVSLVTCQVCGHIYSRIEEDIDYDKFYSEGKYVLQDNRDSLFDKIIQLNNKVILKRIERLTKSRDLLDFGCGKGQFIKLAKDHGWNVFGVETSEPRAKFAKEVYGLQVSSKTYESGKIEKGSFDVLVLFHVIEHLTHPWILLDSLLKHNLKSGGLMVIEVPNIESWQSRIAGRGWIHLDPPIHFSHFSRRVLESSLSDLCIAQKRVSYMSLPLGILGMCQALMYRMGYKGKLIEDLKFNRSKSLLLRLAIVLPLATFLEVLSLAFSKGGVLRFYGEYQPDTRF